MILDDVRDKVFDALQTAKVKLEESDTYNQIKERYDTLSPAMQNVVLTFVGLIFSFIVLQFPLSYFDQGSENLALYDENRDLVLDLYKVKRRSLTTPQTTPPLEAADLEARARNAVTNARVQPEQIKGITFFDNSTSQPSTFIPKNIKQNGVELRLANLNLNQISEIGQAVTNIPSAKVVGVEVRAGTLPGNYFDAIFKIVSFSVPTAPVAGGKAGSRGK